MATWAQVNGSGQKENREKDDFYPTPPEGTAPLLAVERFDGPIWEPACGQGHMSRVLEDAGHDVISTDLVHRGYGEGGVDFLMEWRPRAPNIVTNPPVQDGGGFRPQGTAARQRQSLHLGPPPIPRGSAAQGVV